MDTRFLFRTEQGLIDPALWWKGSLWLGVLFAGLTAICALLLPYTHHDLAETPLFAWSVFGAYVYLVVYIFALILISISFYNLSAKRWRDRGKPGALAGLPSIAALVAGAARWLHPQMADVVPQWSVTAIDAVFLALVIWSVVELGFLPSRLTRD